MYSPEIDQSTKLTMFGEIKSNIKLCNNNKAKSRDQEGYNPTYKFDFPYKAFVENTSKISANSDDNQVVDESSWPHCGYGEAGSIIYGRLSQNKNFSKGGQNVLSMDYGRFRIRAYMHSHKLYNYRKQGW